MAAKFPTKSMSPTIIGGMGFSFFLCSCIILQESQHFIKQEKMKALCSQLQPQYWFHSWELILGESSRRLRDFVKCDQIWPTKSYQNAALFWPKNVKIWLFCLHTCLVILTQIWPHCCQIRKKGRKVRSVSDLWCLSSVMSTNDSVFRKASI